jgi:hypothetical protein
MRRTRGPKRPALVYPMEGDIASLPGVVIGPSTSCRARGCPGTRLPVRWPNGHITYPCTTGLRRLADGNYRVL